MKIFKPKSTTQSLPKGEVAVVWTGGVGDSVQHKITHIALQYLKPWLSKVTHGTDKAVLAQVCPAADCIHPWPYDDASVKYLTLELAAKGQRLYTPMQFFMTLDHSLDWQCRAIHLLQRHTAFPNSSGLVSAGKEDFSRKYA